MKKIFDLNFYSIKHIEMAAVAYENIAQINLEIKGDECNCEFLNAKAETELVIKEFCNYILEIMNIGGMENECQ